MHECKTKMANSKIFSISWFNMNSTASNSINISVSWINQGRHYFSSGHYHGMQQQRTFTCEQLGKRGQSLHICKWQYLIKKVLHGPFQHISTLIPFQSKSIFRNAENGKTGATNQWQTFNGTKKEKFIRVRKKKKVYMLDTNIHVAKQIAKDDSLEPNKYH